MREYLFYPCRSDGVGLTFEAIHLPADADADADAYALARAGRVLEVHGSADLIVVWSGDQLLHRVVRQSGARPTALGKLLRTER